MPERSTMHVAYRAVLLAAGLVALGLLFRTLTTLILLVLMTVIISIPLAALPRGSSVTACPARWACSSGC